jgi:NTE family protein
MTQVDATVPVRFIDGDSREATRPGIGLCLSGGGYRAMLFHVGALWRLHEANVLAAIARISSVSGGSITAGVLAMNWTKVMAGGTSRAPFEQWLVAPVRSLASRTVDEGSILSGLFLPGTIGDKVANAYNKHLFHDARLSNLADDGQGVPRFVFNATNVQTGSLWRFSKPYMGDYQVGLIRNPDTLLARAVAASSAFPPVLSPVTLDVDPSQFDQSTKGDLFFQPYNDEVVLSDGGVYDNLGLETVWKNYQTVLVSDAGGHLGPDPHPKGDWAQHSIRVLNLIDNQVRALRKRQLIDSYTCPPGDQNYRKGSYWSIRSLFADYRKGMPEFSDPLGLVNFDPTPLADVKTRLKAMDDATQERLINWGYAICDTALRRHVQPNVPAPAFPYPRGL